MAESRQIAMMLTRNYRRALKRLLNPLAANSEPAVFGKIVNAAAVSEKVIPH